MNSRARVVAALTLILAVGVVFSGCGSSKLIITVLLSPVSPTVLEGKTQAFTATLTNDTTSKGVNWTVTCSVSSCGMLSAATTTSVTYTAPGPVASNLTVTLTATSIADTTKTGTATITVPAITVAVAPTSATVNAGSSTTITPTVTNDPSAAPGVTWTVSCSTAPCGSVSPTSTASGTATTYTAPTTAPASNLTVTVAATSATDNTKSASSTITVPAISVAISPLTPTVQEGQTKQFTATVSGTSNQNVTWILTCGVASCGTLSSNTSNPTTYTAPGPPASNLTVTITARSTADPTKSASTTIAVPAITVSVSPNSATVVVNTTQNFTATVTNDPSATPSVNWTLSGTGCTGAACGTLSSPSSASGTPIVYTAPATVPTPATVTLKATSATDTTKTATATITVAAAPPITVSVSPSTASVAVNGTQNFTAIVANDSANNGVTWALSGSGCSGSTCGTLSNVTKTSVTYTAPATVPTLATVTLTAKSVTDTTKTGTATITVTTAAAACTSGGSESLLNGQYAFLLKGFDNGKGTGETARQPALVGGVITVDGAGHITAGAIDINQNSGFTSNALTSGSYHVTSDQRGCMVITTSAGTQNYRFSLGNITSGVASTGHVIDFDSAGPFTAGVLRKQDSTAFSTAQVTGNYAFGVSSVQNVASCSNGVCGGKFGAVGVFNLAAGFVTGGQVDFNNNGGVDGGTTSVWPSTPISINNNGSYTVTANGRGMLTFTPAAPGAAAVHAVIYVVSATDVLILGSDPQTTNSAFAGEALQQPSTPFTANPLSGAYIGYQSGLNSGASRASILLITVSGTSITGTQLRMDGSGGPNGTFQSQSISNVNYSVTPAGRMTLTGAGAMNPPIFYLVSPNQIFILNANSSVDAGFFQSQTGSSFSSTSLSGTYAFGTVDPEAPAVNDNSGIAVFTSPNVSVTVDGNNNGFQSLGKMPASTSYSIDSTGLGTIPSGCSITATSTTCNVIFYLISPTKVAVLDSVNSTTPDIQIADK